MLCYMLRGKLRAIWQRSKVVTRALLIDIGYLDFRGGDHVMLTREALAQGFSNELHLDILGFLVTDIQNWAYVEVVRKVDGRVFYIPKPELLLVI